jgi:hypothetical protein
VLLNSTQRKLQVKELMHEVGLGAILKILDLGQVLSVGRVHIKLTETKWKQRRNRAEMEQKLNLLSTYIRQKTDIV